MVTSKAHPHVGVGLYGLADAARLLHVAPSTLRSWLSPTGGLVPRRLPAEERTITFSELMELHFIAMFRSEGVSLQTIRLASAATAARFSTDYPFSVKRFDTDGRTVFATLTDEEQDRIVIEDLKRGQYVFERIMKPFFHKLEFRGARDVARFWPMEKRGRVLLDPRRKFGRPIDAETGVPTRAIYNAYRAAGRQDERMIAKWFDVPLQAVNAAIAFESQFE